MDYCISCNRIVSEAKFLLVETEVYKSCPGCSDSVGEHIFYECPEAFGTTERRITTNNPMGLQSHCSKCRSNKQGPHDKAIRCSEIAKKSGVIISEIRFLPMSTSIFASYEEAKDFLLYEMPNRGNTYYYMKSHMDCLESSLVMFQFEGRLIGYAIFEEWDVFAEPVCEDGAEYLGYYRFKEGSTRVLKTPITAEMFRGIDKEFKSFNQSHQKRPVGMLPALFQLINTGKGCVKARRDVETIPEEIAVQDLQDIKEGHKKQIVVNAYERNPEARRRCITYYRKLNQGRIKCEICGFDFGKVYGEEFEGKIHIHHIKDIATIGEEYIVDAIKDLLPICPNCHMVAHSRTPALLPEEIKRLLEENIDKKEEEA